MVLNLERRDADLLETVIIDPDATSTFTVPRPFRMFSDTAPAPLAPVKGLGEIGPYDVNTSDPHLRRSFEKLEVIGAYPRHDLDILAPLTELIGYLNQGYRAKGGSDINFTSFATIFRMTNCVFPPENEFLEYDLSDLEPFRVALISRATEVRSRGNGPLVLTAVRSHKTVTTTPEVYQPLKRLITRLDIPSQFLSDYESGETGVLYQVANGWSLGWALWNVALAIYTKLGGLPWAVSQSAKPEQQIDVTIGLRFARLTGEEKGFCLGVATVLDRFGRLIGTVPLENMEYHKTLDTPVSGMTLSAESARRLVTGALDSVLLDPRTQTIMQARGPLTLAFHKLGPGPFHHEETEGVRQALAAKLRGRETKVAFVPISESETLAAFGPPSVGRAMQEGKSLRLTNDTALLYTMSSSDRTFLTPITVKLQNYGEADCAFKGIEEACAHEPKAGSPLWKTQWYL